MTVPVVPHEHHGRGWSWWKIALAILGLILLVGLCTGAEWARRGLNQAKQEALELRNSFNELQEQQEAAVVPPTATPTRTPRPEPTERAEDPNAVALATANALNAILLEAIREDKQAEEDVFVDHTATRIAETEAAETDDEEFNPFVEEDAARDQAVGQQTNYADQSTARAAGGGDTQADRADGGYGGVPDSGLPNFQSRRVSHSHNDSYAPEEGVVRPGYGTSDIEIMTVVGYELRFQTAQGEVVFGGGCQQAIVPPNTYAWNAGGQDWNYTGWYWDNTQTEWINEMAVLSWELAQQQIDWEDCPNRTPEERMAHVLVVEQDGKFVKLTPWSEWRRASGVDHTIMFMPGDRVYGWSIGLGSAYTGTPGQDGQDNLCLGGECYLPSAPTIGWCGGCIINSTWPGEIPDNARPIDQGRINQVMATLPPEG